MDSAPPPTPRSSARAKDQEFQNLMRLWEGCHHYFQNDVQQNNNDDNYVICRIATEKLRRRVEAKF